MKDDVFCWEEQVVIITGGGRGIGAAAAKRFAEKGAKVVISSRTEGELTLMKTAITRAYPDCHIKTFTVDMADPKEIERIFRETQELFGPISILVNNAAFLAVSPFLDTTIDIWDQTLQVNVRAVALASQHAFIHMMDRGGGSIINISSLGGLQQTEKFSGLSAYVTSKFAVTGLTEALAVEGKPYNIRVNALAPGAVDTKMLHDAAPFLKTSTTPDDVARLIVCLADPTQSGKLSGAVIPVYSNE